MRKILYVLLFLTLAKNILAAPVINEIYPAPQLGESEWVELYNDGGSPLYIYNYYLTDLADNKIKLATDTIGALGFAVATSSSILNNAGDTLFLKNSFDSVVDIATYSGSINSSRSFARCPDRGDNWFTSSVVTKNYSNQSACFALTPTLPPSGQAISPITPPTVTITETPPTTPISFSNVFLSEAMVNPTANDAEWIEIYNGNDFAVNLTDWFIDDDEGAGSAPKKFSLDISAKGYKTHVLSSSVFNNDGDAVRLLDSNKSLKDDFEYDFSVPGQTYGRVAGEENFCLQQASFEAVNNPCLNPVVLVASTIAPTGMPTKTPTVEKQNTVRPRSPAKIGAENVRSGKVEVLGASIEKTSVDTTRQLSFLSLSYSLLTLISILIKMKFKYGSPKKILLSFFYSPRRQ